MNVPEFLSKYFKEQACKSCGAPFYFVPDKFNKEKSKTVDPDGTPHWQTCTSESAQAFRDKIKAQGGTKRPEKGDEPW